MLKFIIIKHLRKESSFSIVEFSVLYRRVPCHKQGGVKFQLKGTPYWLLVLVFNVGNAGDVSSVSIKGSNLNWLTMSKSWGQNWLIGG
ncbi:hypothetical protein AAHE18_02G011700 [Arachis hypogaea]